MIKAYQRDLSRDTALKLNVYQKTLEASLDLNQIHDAQNLLEYIRQYNPHGEKSVRFRLLQGMFYECVGDYDEAIEIYQNILKEKPLHKEALKRNIAIAKALNAPQQAIKWLNRYLTLHATDAEAHAELVDLYLDENEFLKASVACEQLLLLEPENWAYNIKYADVLCRVQRYGIARKYYAKSLNVKEDDNLRAALGMLLCFNYVTEANDSKLRQYLQMYVTQIYAKKRSPLVDSVKEVFARMS